MDSTFILTIDGLHTGMIGAYGNGWIHTPTLDALACESVLFDRFYARTLHLPSLFETFWQSGVLLQGHRTILLTDDSDVYHHRLAADFGQRHLLACYQGRSPVATLEETQFFKALASAVDLIRLDGPNGADDSRPYVIWTHLRGFRGPWDFPMEYRRRHWDEEEDPEPYAGTAPPELICRNPGEAIHPDDLQAVLEAYAGGISVLDESLAGLIELFDGDALGKKPLLILAGCRGFSLGEHARIGPNKELYGENLQVPLFLRFPDGFARTVRIPALLTTNDLADYLAGFSESSVLAQLVREEMETARECIVFDGLDGEKALITPDWFLRQTGTDVQKYELHSKPDDRWEINNVANRCPEILETLKQGLGIRD